jgi:cation/acetate symporter
MVGTAGLPHVLIRFYTVPSVRAARWSAFWALVFIGVLYTTAPAVATFARVNLIQTLEDRPYAEAPPWFRNWEKTGLVAWLDKNGDGRIQYRPGDAFDGSPRFLEGSGAAGQRLVENPPTATTNELYVDRDIMVLANPEIARLPAWVIGLVAAGGLAAALSTAAGLLLVISSAISHDLVKRVLKPGMSELQELKWARVAACFAVVVAGYFGIRPPGFVAQVVAFAFGLAASSFFPVILLGVFDRRTTRQGAIAGMLTGIGFTAAYIVYFKFVDPAANVPEHWLLGISPEGIGAVGMLVNFAVTVVVSRLTPAPPPHVQELVDRIRLPTG